MELTPHNYTTLKTTSHSFNILNLDLTETQHALDFLHIKQGIAKLGSTPS